MAKVSKEELKTKVSGLGLDNETTIGLLEDIEDSMDVVNNEDAQKVTELEQKYADLQEKYKQRFLDGSAVPDDKKDDTEELKEKEIIDIKEI